MAHKKITKKQRQKLRFIGIGMALSLVGVLFGLFTANTIMNNKPRDLVWAADKNVSVPDDLREYLLNQPACKNPSTGEEGRNLWSVMQVEQSKYARIAYGCSVDLQQYQMAVSVNGEWQLLDRKKYFNDSDLTVLPGCQILDDFNIPSSIEPFCINKKGKAITNSN